MYTCIHVYIVYMYIWYTCTHSIQSKPVYYVYKIASFRLILQHDYNCIRQ